MLHKRIVFAFLSVIGLALTGCNLGQNEGPTSKGGGSKGNSNSQPEEQDFATTPQIDLVNNTITYGLYPQTVVRDSDLLSKLEENAQEDPGEDNGFYLYQGSYYAYNYAIPYSLEYKFTNGQPIEYTELYWFKCEPIVWNILSTQGHDYYVLSSKLLDVHKYSTATSTKTVNSKTIYQNNYQYSDINSPWLNIEFYLTAFFLNNSFVRETRVVNSADTTNSVNTKYACDNFSEEIYLPSYQEYIDASLGFSSKESRCCKVSDWALINGARVYSQNGSYANNGYYWTRSPHNAYDDRVWAIDYDGNLYDCQVDDNSVCMRPCLHLYI